MHAYWFLKIVLVIALVAVASVIATPKGRLPLALRGLARMLGRDRGLPPQGNAPASTVRRLLAFVLVVIAFLIVVI